MIDEFDEVELDKLIQEALTQSDSTNPLSPNVHLGISDSHILSILHNSLSKRFIESEVNDIFQEVRGEINSSTFRISLKDVHTVTKNCKKCDIESSAELPKWNVENPDIVVVIDSPSLPQEAIQLMLEAFKQADLSSKQLCLTYVNRCPVKRKYDNQEIINCSRYLHSEIISLNPKLILCLGAVPTTAIFGAPPSTLKDFRGEVAWIGNWPIMVTYSPMYVLKAGDHAQQAFISDIRSSKSFITT